MGWFNKKEEKEDSNSELPELPKLPNFQRLDPLQPPRLPSAPQIREPYTQLPSLPNSATGNRFSQNAIKDAVISSPPLENMEIQRGEEEEEIPMIPQLPKKKFAIEIPEEYHAPKSRTKKDEPMFIRLDKFEESVQIIEKAKKELEEVESKLAETKK